MIISRTQLKALDAVPMDVFLDKVESLARACAPQELFEPAGLRSALQTWYQEACILRLHTERSIAAYILEQLKIRIDANQLS